MPKAITLSLFLTLAFAPLANAGTVRALSAGIGAEDRAPHPEYPVKLVFFVKGGAYLANVKVQVSNQTGGVVYRGTSEGPWLFVDLPSGRYKVVATEENGDRQGVRFALTPGMPQKQVALMFPN